jgi:hypothetical protein
MNEDELIRDVAEGARDVVGASLEHWFKCCPRFIDFVHFNRNKIRKKLRDAKTDPQVCDVLAELDVACLLLSDCRVEVEYEKFGSQSSPDLSATFNFNQIYEINFEVTRIGDEDLPETRFVKWKNEAVDQVRTVPSHLGFWFEFVICADASLVAKLESQKENIILFCTKTIQEADAALPMDLDCKYPVPGFEGELSLGLVKFSGNTRADQTAHFGDVEPTFYTGREAFKFRDKILEKVKKLRPRMINVLVIITESIPHESSDLIEAIGDLRAHLAAQDAEAYFKKGGFEGGRAEFLLKADNLSAILFRSPGSGEGQERNFLWPHRQAKLPIPDPVMGCLKSMDRPLNRASMGV